ncbi:IS30 family transposase [Sinorhizobium fredii]
MEIFWMSLCYSQLTLSDRRHRRRGSRKPRDGLIPFDCRISQRPEFIADRSEFGHWEGDLLIFERTLGNANVTSLVERKSRYTVMIKNGSRHSQSLIDKIVNAFSPLPAFARQSFTFDRGTELRSRRHPIFCSRDARNSARKASYRVWPRLARRSRRYLILALWAGRPAASEAQTRRNLSQC